MLGPSADNASLTASTSCRWITGGLSIAVGHVFLVKIGPRMDWTRRTESGIKERNVILRDWERGLGLGDGCVPREKRVKLSGYGIGLKVCTESFFRSF